MVFTGFRPLTGNEFKNLEKKAALYKQLSEGFRPLTGNEFKNKHDRQFYSRKWYNRFSSPYGE